MTHNIIGLQYRQPSTTEPVRNSHTHTHARYTICMCAKLQNMPSMPCANTVQVHVQNTSYVVAIKMKVLSSYRLIIKNHKMFRDIPPRP